MTDQQRPKRDRAEYMRNYRASVKAGRGTPLEDRVSALEDEVRRLTAALAKRPTGTVALAPASRPAPVPAETSFNSRPFTPAPKAGR